METNFINDKEKIADLLILSKDEFLNSYTYLTENEYNSTIHAITELVNTSLDKNLAELIDAEEEREYLQNILEQADAENIAVEDVILNRIERLYNLEKEKGDE